MPIRFALIGAGGHARVVYDALWKNADNYTVEVRDDDADIAGTAFFDLIVAFPALGDGWPPGMLAHVAIGRNEIRARVVARAESAGATLATVCHPDAKIALEASVGAGSFLAAGSILGPCSCLGRACIVNHGAVVDHDCLLGDWVHIAPGAVLGGGVKVGDGCLIGAGAVVLPGLSVGPGCVVGAGAVVTRDLLAGSRAQGVPARAN